MQNIYLRVFLTTIFVTSLFSPTTLKEIVVRTNLGSLVGKKFVTSLNRTVHSFLGVPFAKPPVGELRFEEPQPIGKWDGKWLATESSSQCLQMLKQGVRGNEDCLYLDIYTPYLTESSSVPVLVYFHGGAFKIGNGKLWKPYFLMDTADFVYVSVNYRLGSLGFLSTEDDVVPGNNGLKDQVMALRWVQENIDKFGGNKNEVTISGHSAGGVSAHLHFMSPLSRGLFNRGVSMSGSALSNWALSKKPLQKSKGFGVGHGEDLSYIFGISYNLTSTGPSFESDGDQAMARVMQGVLVNFLQTGNPIGVTENKLPWTPQPKGFTNSTLHYLLISNAPSFTMTTSPNFGNSEFWNSLEFNENENYHYSEEHFRLGNGSVNEQFTLIVTWIISMLLVYLSVE